MAYLEGRKTMTRRIMRPQPPPNAIMKRHSEYPDYWIPYTADGRLMNSCQGNRKNDCGWHCPHGQVGDVLWWKETFAEWQGTLESVKNGDLSVAEAREYIVYKATTKDWQGLLKDEHKGHPWIIRPSIFMPRWASRITTPITGLRVERLNCMTESDAHLEGVDNLVTFMLLWDKLNKKRGYEWKKNRWVWILGFPKV